MKHDWERVQSVLLKTKKRENREWDERMKDSMCNNGHHSGVAPGTRGWMDSFQVHLAETVPVGHEHTDRAVNIPYTHIYSSLLTHCFQAQCFLPLNGNLVCTQTSLTGRNYLNWQDEWNCTHAQTLEALSSCPTPHWSVLSKSLLRFFFLVLVPFSPSSLLPFCLSLCRPEWVRRQQWRLLPHLQGPENWLWVWLSLWVQTPGQKDMWR